VQSEIAEQVIRQLEVTLLAPEREALASTPTENMEAHQADLRGRLYSYKISRSDLQLAEQMFERAVKLDPGFAELRLSRDAHIGPNRLMDLALIYTMVGEPDLPLDQIEELLSIPAFFSVPLLELHPQWDPLREHRRYQEIVKEFAISYERTS
jgi:hypothetical protein